MEWIEKCIHSLANEINPNNIICIDNGSRDKTTEFIKDNFPSVHCIVNDTNLGFGQANNMGLAAAIANNADYVFLLNQDAWIEKGTIKKLISIQKNNPAIGILSPVHLTDSNDRMDAYFRRYLADAGIDTPAVKKILNHDYENELINVKFVNAAAWLLSIDCLKKTGGFDPVFFHYGEDGNYCQRAIFNGFQIAVLTNSFIHHDREQRTQHPPVDSKSKLKQEKLHFLLQACDVNTTGYLWLIMKRFLRYSLLSVTDLLLVRKKRLYADFGMAKAILMFMPDIIKSRKINISGQHLPHL